MLKYDPEVIVLGSGYLGLHPPDEIMVEKMSRMGVKFYYGDLEYARKMFKKLKEETQGLVFAIFLVGSM